MTTTERTVALGDVELTVFETGVGGRPLLVVHGFYSQASDFAAFFERLAAEGWHVVVPDLRGHGSSGGPDDESAYSLDIFAADVIGVADAVGFDRFVVLGHSMGGMITQLLVLANPDRVAGLILMDTGHGAFDVDPALVELGVEVARSEGMDAVADVMAAMDDDPLTTDAYRRLVAEDPSQADRSDRNVRATSAAMFASMLQQIPVAPDRLDALASVSAPTLVVVGEEDLPFLDASRRMAEVIPGSRLAVLAGGGHSPQFESPEAWWAAVSGFLAEVAVDLPVRTAPV